MSHLVIVIDTDQVSIADLNAQCQKPTKPHDEAIALRNFLEAMLAGSKDYAFYVVTRDTDPAVSTSGSGSAKEEYSLK